MALISESLVSALENQMGHENKNAHIYLFVAGFLNSKGMDKIAAFFENQYQEELGHFKMIYSFLVDLDVCPNISEVQETSQLSLGLGESIVSVAEKFMEREVLTTENLGELLDESMAEGNYIAEEFLRGMIEKQQHEYAEATEFMDKAKICGDNWMNVLIWNGSFG